MLTVAVHGAKLAETKNHDAFKVVSYSRTGKIERPDYIDAENASMSMFLQHGSRGSSAALQFLTRPE